MNSLFTYGYEDFADHVSREARYILNPAAKGFIAAVLKTGAHRTISYSKGDLFWRAQIAHKEQRVRSRVKGSKGRREFERAIVAADAQRMTPFPDRAREGRVNPKGIPCLYLSTDIVTAMSEVRPPIDSYVSVARFSLTKQLKMVNCARDPYPPNRTLLHALEPQVRMTDLWAWHSLNMAYSEPVTPSDDVGDYAPTQLIAEAFRAEGYDGIVYRSRLGQKLNLAVFKITNAAFKDCKVFRVDDLKYSFLDFERHRYEPAVPDNEAQSGSPRKK